MKLFNALVAAVLVTLPLAASAEDVSRSVGPSQTPEAVTADVVTIRMKDGSTLLARIITQEDHVLKVVTVGGLAMEIPRTSVDRVDQGRSADSPARPSDSNYTRLLFSPTGRPLAKGAGYFSDHYVVFPGLSYGLTDNLSIGAGVSAIPGLGLGEQMLYVAPRLGKQFSEQVAVSAGLLYAHAGDGGDEGDLGVGFAMATFGKPDKSLTVGGGVARTVDHDSVGRFVGGRLVYETRRRVSHTPVIMVGGTARLSRRIALVSENWLILHDDFKLENQPFAVGVRFLGDRLSADVGVILVGELIDEGFPIPWLSVTYHFGSKR
ncbi:MAG: hypothetical protein JJE39_07415 [Vicinamibacteria bacterium]|nr:hypothetical protein [Vicinamibacteria bacterium]